jgi:hypothetical protein
LTAGKKGHVVYFVTFFTTLEDIALIVMFWARDNEEEDRAISTTGIKFWKHPLGLLQIALSRAPLF